MKFKEVTLFGATGLIGGYLLKTLLKDSNIHLINIVGRKPKFMVLNKLESTDIDEKIDFETAQMIYRKTFK